MPSSHLGSLEVANSGFTWHHPLPKTQERAVADGKPVSGTGKHYNGACGTAVSTQTSSSRHDTEGCHNASSADWHMEL